MTRIVSGVSTVVLMIALVGGAFATVEAEAVTLEGEVICALCTLKEEGVKHCQNVLQVEGEEGAEPALFYFVKNDVSEKLGHVCKSSKNVKVTGTVAEKDGKKWITASNIELLEKS